MNKKLIYLSLSFIFILCGLVFTGCTENPNKYFIDAKVLHAQYGFIQGGNQQYSEGTTITLLATPKSQSNPFICWLCNNKTVSTNNELTFTVNSETAGEYIALFECPDIEYVSLSNFTVNLQNDPNALINLTKAEIYLGKHETLLYKTTELLNTKVGPSFEIKQEEIYTTDIMPYSFDMQENIYIKVVLFFEKDSTQYVSTTNLTILASDSVSEVPNITRSLNIAKNENDSNLQLSNPINISIQFNRISDFNLNPELENN